MREVLEQHFHVLYNSFTMPAEGEGAISTLFMPELETGDFLLVVEGTVPTAYGGRTAVLGKHKGQDITALQAVKRLGSLARWVVAAGTCASFGGPYAAWPNPTDSRPLSKVLSRKVIKVPGCPSNPGWIIETLMRLREGREMELDYMGRPRFLFGTTVHSLCERLPFFHESRFAEKTGDSGCLYLLGCKGPVTRADCPERRWIEERTGWPVGVNTPCIGCTSPEYPDYVAPFFKHQTDIYRRVKRVNLETLGILTGIVTAADICAHFTGNILTGRIKIPGLAGKKLKIPGLAHRLLRSKKKPKR